MKLTRLKNNAQKLNRLGLILGMVGVIILFICGPPQPKFEKGIGIMVEDETVINGKTSRELDTIIERRIKNHKVFSSLGLAFIFLGFAGQFSATLIPDQKIKIVKGKVPEGKE